MQPQNQINKRNIIILVVICLAIFFGIIIYLISQAFYRSDKIEIGVYYAPFIAKVEIDDNQVKNNSDIWITPGNHMVKVSYEGFETVEFTTNITDTTENLYGALLPLTDAANQIMQDHQNDYSFIDSLSASASIAVGEQNRAEWPIIASLPISNALFSLGYSISEDHHLTLNINSTETYLDDAVTTLKSHATSDHPIAEYNIKFNQWANPLEGNFTINTSADPVEFLRQGYSHLDNLNLVVNTGNTSDNYYYTTITTGSEFEYNLVTYRAVLAQENNSWQLISTPQPITTTYNTPEVPLNILNSANNL